MYFYFAGHGAPDPSSATPYLLPSDGDPKYLKVSGLALKDVLSQLGQSNAREVLAVVDACFSGRGGRSLLPEGARPLVRVGETAAPGHTALLSASGGDETSGTTAQGDGELFTRYLVQGLGNGEADIDGAGQVSLTELANWVRPRVSREAKKSNRDQNPTLIVGSQHGSPDSLIVEWGLPER